MTDDSVITTAIPTANHRHHQPTQVLQDRSPFCHPNNSFAGSTDGTVNQMYTVFQKTTLLYYPACSGYYLVKEKYCPILTFLADIFLKDDKMLA